MKLWLHLLNARTILWLNTSFQFKGRNSIVFWLLHPCVLSTFFCRILFLFLNSFLKPLRLDNGNNQLFAKKTVNNLSDKTILVRKRKSLLDILLYRNVFEKEANVPSLISNQASFNDLASKTSIVITLLDDSKNIANSLQSLRMYLPNVQEIIIVGNKDDIDALKQHQIITSDFTIVQCSPKETLTLLFESAKKAKGKYLAIIDNHTTIKQYWLENLLLTKQRLPNSVLIGGATKYMGRLVFGHLNKKEIWNENPFDPKHNFLKEVNFLPTNNILVEREILLKAWREKTPSKTTALSPFFKNELHLKLFFQPKSEAILLEPPSNSAICPSLNPVVNTKSILIIDVYMPRYDRESGSNRILHITRIVQSLGFHVIFMSASLSKEEPYTTLLQESGVETLYSSNQFNASEFFHLDRALRSVEIAWICRPELNYKYVDIIKKHYKGIRIIYDTIDVHFLRLRREADIYGIQNEWERIKELELSLCAKAHKVIAITNVDEQLLLQNGVDKQKITLIPNIHVFKPIKNKFEDRKGILFIGSYDHEPNVDAAVWLCGKIMPLVWKQLPDLNVILLGNNPKAEVTALINSKIHVPGFVHDVSPYFESSKIFVAPLRFGAGMKGKIGQSYEYGMPIISTSIGIEGMGLVHDENVLVADEADDFAEQIIRLYSNHLLWQKLHDSSENAIHKFSPEVVQKEVAKILEELS